MKVFVTGATGMLGANLVLQLIQDGHQVLALVRNPKKAESNLPPGVETVMGDLQDVSGFSERLGGCQALVHCAAYFREYYGGGEHAQILEKLNVEASLQLLDAALRAGVERFVHISSSGTVGHRADGLPGGRRYAGRRLEYGQSLFPQQSGSRPANCGLEPSRSATCHQRFAGLDVCPKR